LNNLSINILIKGVIISRIQLLNSYIIFHIVLYQIVYNEIYDSFFYSSTLLTFVRFIKYDNY